VWSFVHVDDAATATIAAIERGDPGLYNIVDDEPAPASEWLPELARIVGAPEPRHIPVWLGRLAGGDAVVSMFTRIRGSANGKAKRELGWIPRYGSWREGFRYGLSDTATEPVSRTVRH
jgi:nucleoside-diphosphate-sugar epimerase